MVTRSSPWIRTPIDLPLACFLLWVLCTVPFATDPSYSFAEWRKFLTHSLVFYWATLVFHRSGRDLLPTHAILAASVGGALLAAYALLDFVLIGGTWRDRIIRARAINSDYNWLSTYMVLFIPLVAGLTGGAHAPWVRILKGPALLLTTLAQVFSYTRAGWVAHAVQGLSWGALIGGRRAVAVVAGVGLILAAILAIATTAGYQRDTVDTTTIETRIGVWRVGVSEVLSHPLLGIGYGNDSFLKKFPEYSPQAQGHLPARAQTIPAMHSMFMMVALGSGLPAFACFLWMLAALLRRLLAHCEYNKSAVSLRIHPHWIGVGVLGFCARNLFDYMFMGSLAYLFWILAAAGVALTSGGRNREGQARTDDF